MQKTLTFHNTIALEGQDLLEAIDKAKTQEEKTLIFFRNSVGKEFTPDEVTKLVFKDSCPITSVRRAMSNLTRMGKIYKTENKKAGRFGSPNYMWKLSVNVCKELGNLLIIIVKILMMCNNK